MKTSDERLVIDPFQRDMRAKILRGDFKLGESLTPERQLTKKLGLGLALVRDALNSLAEEGLLTRA